MLIAADSMTRGWPLAATLLRGVVVDWWKLNIFDHVTPGSTITRPPPKSEKYSAAAKLFGDAPYIFGGAYLEGFPAAAEFGGAGV